jgi:NAD(P)-dependent dehydrogenase (short-subunit alcohol dehydrogenase family)
MKEAAGRMADNGRVINLVTTQVAVTAPTYSAYAGSKSPVEHFTKAFAKEIGHRGITVNCVAPGPRRQARAGRLSIVYRPAVTMTSTRSGEAGKADSSS